jgi:zinc D-Ala-D-Ala dipeptidase
MEGGASANKALTSYPPVSPAFVMSGILPHIPAFFLLTVWITTWMAGTTSSAMTMEGSGPVKAIAIVLVVAGLVSPAGAQTLPGGFAYLREIDPTILQDIRYAGSNNFIGRPLRGYEAAECVVKREVGLALKRVQQEFAAQRRSLKMLDCYRPARAVANMVAWARDDTETPGGKRYNPAFSKKDLFRLGYIAEHSGHSTGAAVDLTLVDLTADNSAVFDADKAYADCTAPANLRAPEGSVDMGTGYDCSDITAHTAATSIAPEQRRWRNLLVAAMARQGFVNYAKEWWHFSLPGVVGPAYDFPVASSRR